MPELIFFQRGLPLFQYPLQTSSLKIGRSFESDIHLTGENISRDQLVIYQSEGSFLVKNVGKLPLHINGEPKEMAPLKNKDKLQMADWEIIFDEEAGENYNDDETYVSLSGVEGTLITGATLGGGKCFLGQTVLKISEPQKNPRTHILSQEVTLLGKSPACDLCLEDSYCSENHCKIIVSGRQIILFDLRSTNGTSVNGVKVREAELEDGCKIRIGQTEILVEELMKVQEVRPVESVSFGPLVGKSLKMRELYGIIQQVAGTEATVCIFGETGTGKELVAHSLHELSNRRARPYVALNCGAISRELIESELFGHEKGAFTGAHQQRIGAFEQANGGTLFLDEVGELSLQVQPVLLRVLETGKIKRVGGNQEISVNVRLIAATHRDLGRNVAEGKFREDLFFRIYVLPLFIPPLRERPEDILLITEHFIRQMSPPGKRFTLSSEASRYLEIQEWKGNVRELRNVIQRAVVFAQGGVIRLEDVKVNALSPLGPSVVTEQMPNISSLAQMERELILKELRNQGGNKTAAAKALGIAKSTLYEKLKLYGIGE